MASNPLFIIPDFFCIFQTNFAMATSGLKEMGKFLLEGREKGLPCWLSQFSFDKFVWKMQKKSGIMKSGVDAMPLFLLDHLLRNFSAGPVSIFRLRQPIQGSFLNSLLLYFCTRNSDFICANCLLNNYYQII